MDLCIIKKCQGQSQSGNPLLDIEHFHWKEAFTDFPGVYTRQELYDFLDGSGYAYVIDPEDPYGARRVPLVVARSDGKKYVRCAGAWDVDPLLLLPECE